MRKKHRTSKIVILLLASLAGIFIISLVVWVLFLLVKIPSIGNFQDRQVAESTKIYDHTGEHLLWEIHGEERRTVIPFEDISRHVRNATIAIEDSSFYSHEGVRILSLIRVVFLNAFIGKEIGSGGSTITQQLVKNTILTPEKTISRKIKELVISMKLESEYKKDEILNLYLNEIPYGSNTYGIESASLNYFGKSASDVTLAEAAYLAALPKAPTRYSPYGNNRELLEDRKNTVLSRMKELLFISQEEYDSASNEKVDFLPQKRSGLLAPHFVIYVREQLIDKYGDELVERGGLEVITTLDLKLQQKGEEIVARRGEFNEENFNATNAGLVALDPKTGRILSMIGSRDYFNVEREGNFNITLARRQPGSAFKPLVYVTALERGYTPETMVFDVETNFSAIEDKKYIPQNYDGSHRGPVSLRASLARSLNIPSVKVLYLAGINNVIDTAEDFGISTLGDRSRFGLSLVLGGGEVSPLELTAAYGVFANQGVKAEPHAILSVKQNGVLLEDESVNTERVIDANYTNMLSDILSDNLARSPTFGSRSTLHFADYDVAAKTGTTNNFRDAWTVGYSPNIVVGAWAGNNDNTPMKENISGITIVSPIWREFMSFALSIRAKESFVAPNYPVVEKPVLRGIWRGSRSYILDKNSGLLATKYTPEAYREEKIIQEIHSILYWVDKNNPTADIPKNPARDSQFELWEEPVLAWARQQGLEDEEAEIPITDSDTSHLPENWPNITIPVKEKDKVFSSDEFVVFHPKIDGRNPISAIEIFLDGRFVKSEIGNISSVSLGKLDIGSHSLLLKAYDSIGNKQEESFSFTVGDP